MSNKSESTERLRAMAQALDPDIEFVITAAEPYLPGIETVMAQCVKVDGPKRFNVWGEHRTRLVFTFKVFEPNAYFGLMLPLFVEFNQRWTYLPRTSKIRDLVEIAGQTHGIGVRIRFRELFVNRVFRCKLHHVTEPSRKKKRAKNVAPFVPYTAIETLLERITGPANQ